MTRATISPRSAAVRDAKASTAAATMPATTRTRFLAMLPDHPDWPAGEWAKALGVSRERIRQLKVESGVTLPRPRKKVRQQIKPHPLTIKRRA